MSLGRWMFFLLCGLFILTACGYSVKQTVSPVSPPQKEGFEKIVILPFADYTSSSPIEQQQRNMLILESLQDELLKAGFITVPYEEVINYLLKEGIIKQAQLYKPNSFWKVFLSSDLSSQWSKDMRKEILQAMRTSMKVNKNNNESMALNQETLQKIGEFFGARYIIRGRIIEFSNSRNDTLNPVQTGILPFFLKVGSRTFLGFAESEKYEVMNEMAAGAGYGAGIGGVMGGSVEIGTSLVDPALVGAAIGTGVGLVASPSGKVSQAKVQLRLFLQDANTGEIIWSNRAEISVSPKSVFASNNKDELFVKAVNEATKILISDMVHTLEVGGIKIGGAPSLLGEVKAAAEEAKAAAEEAKAAAKKAEEAAKKSERIFEKTLTK